MAWSYCIHDFLNFVVSRLSRFTIDYSGVDALLQAAQVAQIGGSGGWLKPMAENFWALPAPVLDVAISEGQISALVMPVGWQIDPVIAVEGTGGIDAKRRIYNVIFVNIDKNEKLAWGRAQDLSIFNKRTGVVITVYGDAHIVTAGAGEVEFHAIGIYNRGSVRWAAIDSG